MRLPTTRSGPVRDDPGAHRGVPQDVAPSLQGDPDHLPQGRQPRGVPQRKCLPSHARLTVFLTRALSAFSLPTRPPLLSTFVHFCPVCAHLDVAPPARRRRTLRESTAESPHGAGGGRSSPDR
eukprot:512607-Prorocentrum_minimum.AAC.1